MEIAYAETTIIGHIAGRLLKDPVAAAQQQLPRDWWELAPSRFEIVVSQLVLDECGGGDPSAAQERLEVIENNRLLAIKQEAETWRPN